MDSPLQCLAVDIVGVPKGASLPQSRPFGLSHPGVRSSPWGGSPPELGISTENRTSKTKGTRRGVAPKAFQGTTRVVLREPRWLCGSPEGGLPGSTVKCEVSARA